MGREIRRVPLDWQHPRDEYGNFIPLFDKDYESAARQWDAEYLAWREGKHPAQNNPVWMAGWFWEYASPPNRATCRERQWTEAEATAYQIYETVSEGTPASPVFATIEEMRAWLIGQGYSASATDAFIQHGWVPSMIISSRGEVRMGIHAADFGKERE